MTKTVPVERIQEAFSEGCRNFGENRVQEFLKKKPELSSEIRWHFVGHLQTNKVKSVLGEAALLHSLDRMSLAEALARESEKKNSEMEVLLQVNITGKATQSGFAPAEVHPAVEKLIQFRRLHLRGLMTIGPLTENTELIRAGFRELRELRDRLAGKFPSAGLRELSMGMSSDFEIALEEGATMIRVGTAVFGERE